MWAPTTRVNHPYMLGIKMLWNSFASSSDMPVRLYFSAMELPSNYRLTTKAIYLFVPWGSLRFTAPFSRASPGCRPFSPCEIHRCRLIDPGARYWTSAIEPLFAALPPMPPTASVHSTAPANTAIRPFKLPRGATSCHSPIVTPPPLTGVAGVKPYQYRHHPAACTETGLGPVSREDLLGRGCRLPHP